MPNTLTGADVKSRLLSALETLVEKDNHLLTVDANERSITHRLAVYLEDLFPGWNVDCEYNRNLDAVKRAGIPVRNTKTDKLNAPTVFPDIIVHHRNSEDNLLVIEAKKETTEEDHECGEVCSCDQFKLLKFREQLGYVNSAYLVFPIHISDFSDSESVAASILKEFKHVDQHS